MIWQAIEALFCKNVVRKTLTEDSLVSENHFEAASMNALDLQSQPHRRWTDNAEQRVKGEMHDRVPNRVAKQECAFWMWCLIFCKDNALSASFVNFADAKISNTSKFQHIAI